MSAQPAQAGPKPEPKKGRQNKGQKPKSQPKGKRPQQQQATQGPQISNLCSLGYLQMLRQSDGPADVNTLLQATQEHGVTPSLQLNVLRNALRIMGFGRVCTYASSLRLVPLNKSAADAPRYTLCDTSVGTNPNISCSEPPPSGTIGVLKRTNGLHYVVEEHPKTAVPTAFVWTTESTDEALITPRDLLSMETVFEGQVPYYVIATKQYETVNAGMAIARDLRGAMNGSATAVLRTAVALRGGKSIIPPPAGGMSNGKLTPEALLSLTSWIASGIVRVPDTVVAATVVADWQ